MIDAQNASFFEHFLWRYLPAVLIYNLNFRQLYLSMKIWCLAILCLLATTVLSESLTAEEKEKRINPNLLQISKVYPLIGHRLKTEYWYYLRHARLVFLANIERKGDFIFLSIYRNIVGTFLSITTWKDQSEQIQVNTLVRLGNGDAKDMGALYDPVDLKPFNLKYALGPDEFVITLDDSGNIVVDGILGENDALVEQCKGFSEELVEKYWHYLDKPTVIFSQAFKTNQKDYCTVAYSNIAGVFLAIGSHKQVEGKTVNTVNTFVRLGNGFEEGSGAHYKSISADRYKLDLEEYQGKDF